MQSQSPSYVILDSLRGGRRAGRRTTFSGSLASDVVTNVRTTVNGKEVLTPTVFEDGGRVSMHLALVDPGTAVEADRGDVDQHDLR